MSLPITFHRAASAEFIEASAWYETKRVDLALEFMAEIDRCVSLASKHPLQFAVVREDNRGAGMALGLQSARAVVEQWRKPHEPSLSEVIL